MQEDKKEYTRKWMMLCLALLINWALTFDIVTRSKCIMTENGINGHCFVVRCQAIRSDLEYEWNYTTGHILHYSQCTSYRIRCHRYVMEFKTTLITGCIDWRQCIRNGGIMTEMSVVVINLYHWINPLNPELNPICYLLALLGAHHFLHVSRIRVKLLTFRRLMLYICSTHSWCF